MHPVLRLSINALSGRRSRSLLLIAAVALSTTLITAVACALESITAGLDKSVASAIGKADLRVKRVGEDRFDAGFVELVRRQPEVALVAARLKGPVTLALGDDAPDAAARRRADMPDQQVVATGVDPAAERMVAEYDIKPPGRFVERDGEVVVDSRLAEDLRLRCGDPLKVIGFGEMPTLHVVGILAVRPIEVVRKPEAFLTIATLEKITGFSGKLSEAQVLLHEIDASRAEALAKQYSAQLEQGMLVEPTAPITSGIRAKVNAGRMVFLLASMLNYIAAAFIVLTGLTTNLLERQRELAIMRCIGATRGQLFFAQLGVGGFLGAAGAAVGVPLGVGLVWLLVRLYPEMLPVGLRVSLMALVVGLVGAVLAGLVGAIWPAVKASRAHPLGAMASKASAHRPGLMRLVGIVALVMVLLPLGALWLPVNASKLIFGYVAAGIPCVFTGYFLLGVPMCVGVTWLLGGVVSGLLGLPRALLGRTIAGAPFRNGFTAGSLMVGLAMMVNIWTNGAGVLREFVGAFKFPDAFVQSWTGLTPQTQEKLAALPCVANTCAITLLKVEGTAAFGLKGLSTNRTHFIAFEPEPFFAMTKLVWTAGDPAYAMKRLKEGGAVIVAKEFQVGRKGFEVGQKFPIIHKGERHEFEIVGAVTSPGLDVMNAGFDIGKQYAEEAMGSVFGSREDLKRVFGSDAIHLIQVGLKDGVNDDQAVGLIRSVVGPGMMVGSGKEIRAGIESLGLNALRVASIVAVAAMLIGCAGVANIVVAGISARRFEFGVLRAVGADASLLVRLVYGEVFLIGITACILGTLLGLQSSASAMRLHGMTVGLQVKFRPLPGVILMGSGILLTLIMLSVTPMVVRLWRTNTRELLASTRG